ncbi:hypothetical protein GJ496_006247 [Pomphorhynchus laevis]|nr:hypothetical protein GJ496_006247 [Pomphorhynchus laevis]
MFEILHSETSSELNEKLENIIQLPCLFRGLGIAFPRGESYVAYNCSWEMCRPSLEGFAGEELARVQDTIATQFRRENEVRHKLKVSTAQLACEQGSVILEYSARKGASTWLSTKPIENLSQLLNRQEMCQDFEVTQSLACQSRGMPTVHHNVIPDILANELVIGLPLRYGGMGIREIGELGDIEFRNSKSLSISILEGDTGKDQRSRQQSIIERIRTSSKAKTIGERNYLIECSDRDLKTILINTSIKGASVFAPG